MLFAAAVILSGCGDPDAEFNALKKEQHDAYSAIMAMWNDSIPPHFVHAIKCEKQAAENPQIADSLLAVAQAERAAGNAVKERFTLVQRTHLDSIESLTQKYAHCAADAFGAYYCRRKSIGKDSLALLYKRATRHIRHSDAGKAAERYIKTSQLAKGDLFVTFDAIRADGSKFDWNVIDGKKVLLIDDGLWCMTHGMDNSAPVRFFDGLMGRDSNLAIIIYLRSNNLSEVKGTINEYGIGHYPVISELKGDYGTLSWMYDNQSTPTCIYVTQDGTIMAITEGIDPAAVDDLLQK